MTKATYRSKSLYGLLSQGARVHDERVEPAAIGIMAGGEPEGSHFEPQIGSKMCELEMAQVFTLSKPTSSALPPPARTHLLNLTSVTKKNQLFKCQRLWMALLLFKPPHSVKYFCHLR